MLLLLISLETLYKASWRLTVANEQTCFLLHAFQKCEVFMYMHCKLCHTENTHKSSVARIKWEQAVFIFTK